jgi:hypothetical protein
MIPDYFAIFLKFEYRGQFAREYENYRSNSAKKDQQWLARVDSLTFLSTTRQQSPRFETCYFSIGFKGVQAATFTSRALIDVTHWTAEAASDCAPMYPKKKKTVFHVTVSQTAHSRSAIEA